MSVDIHKYGAARFVQANHINELAQEVHKANKKWWTNLETGEPAIITGDMIGTKIALAHSELSEALEGFRKDQMDDKLPHRKMIEVELVDAIIRILDLGAALKLDLGGAYVEKMAFNASRKDHTLEARREANGKKF